MTKRDALGIAIRILGLWMLASMIPWLPSLAYPVSRVMGLSAADARQYVFIELVSYCMVLIVGFYLLAYAKRIAAALMPEDSELTWPEWISSRNVLFGWAAGVLGLVLIARYLPVVLITIAEHVYSWRTQLSVHGKSADWVSVTMDVLGLAIGCALLFGCRALANWIERGDRAPGPVPEAGNE